MVRVYDSLGGKCRGKLQWGELPVKKAWRCNLLEDDLEELEISEKGMNLEVRPFEVVSFRLEL